MIIQLQLYYLLANSSKHNHRLTRVRGQRWFSIFIKWIRREQVGDISERKVGKHRHQVLLVLQSHYPREVARRPLDVKLRPLSTPAVADVPSEHRSISRVCLQA